VGESSRDEFVMRLQPSEAMYMKLTVGARQQILAHRLWAKSECCGPHSIQIWAKLSCLPGPDSI
jgi:hypothetical protein